MTDRIGIDVGSTTAKLVVLDSNGELLFSLYRRHNVQAREVVVGMLEEAVTALGDREVAVRITGSVGMGLAERYGIQFVQEVVAAAKAVQRTHPGTSSMIDIGGEDAKVVFFRDGTPVDLRMNGNCAGGTGAFIDQMAVILGMDVQELNGFALNATRLYPIASRCGVFCKTDIQNLIAKNVPREDISASIFHAVAVQTAVTLAHGCDITPPVLFCGGPLTFIPALRKAFMEYLALDETQIIVPHEGVLLPATGAALSVTEGDATCHLSALAARLREMPEGYGTAGTGLAPIFSGKEEYDVWKKRISRHHVPAAKLHKGVQEVFLGIDSGSTTTKIVVTDTDQRILYSYYAPNGGNPVEAVEKGLACLQEECRRCDAELHVAGSCSTGYGEALVKAAFRLDAGIVETMAHYMASHHLDKEVSFILDIGGQDMKAMFVDNGIIDRMEINEACSSGCGSFIETFARTLGYTAQEFAAAACRSASPCELGTRCTVFMNSKVKQALREGATVDDIAAGLAYSVVKNCLYKVLKLKDISALGKHIVVQGGTMRNDAVVRALELLTGTEVTRCDVPELMGAFGCALYAAAHPGIPATLDSLVSQSGYTTRLLHCKGCSNQCQVVRYRFSSGNEYYSGNRCEKVFSNGECYRTAGENMYRLKNEMLFHRAESEMAYPLLTVGIPRCLNMYEEFPFWHTLFTACGIQVRLSAPSEFRAYEQHAKMVMSDNICFPAKLVHSHIQDLADQHVDRIFMPFVVYEKQDGGQNSFNCPIVTGYSDVIKGGQPVGVPVDSPVISFREDKLLFMQCRDYLSELGVDKDTIKNAFSLALDEQETYRRSLAARNRRILAEGRAAGRLVMLLAGRPYHTDPLIQHKVSDMVAGMGIDVITDDVAYGEDIAVDKTHFLAQWAYPNRILKAARWCAMQDGNVQFVEMTSFGCGPDAFLTDSVRDVLAQGGKTLTLLKLDDINNAGSMKLRVRSLAESLRLSGERGRAHTGTESFRTAPPYDDKYRDRKIIIPYFTPFLSPLIPAVMRVAGYDMENLPLSNAESCEWGLKYANNEVCYPATLIVGDIVKAFKSGRYDPAHTVVAMTQTGGQCRASNYVPLLKKALVDAGYEDTPVISMTFGGDIKNEQPAFRIDWVKLLPVALRAILYSDCISKFYYASTVRERIHGEAARLRDEYLSRAECLISEHRSKDLYACLADAAYDFNVACRSIPRHRVGVVGEIFLKFNPFAQKNVIEWLTERGIEVVPSPMTDFFMQSFVNNKARVDAHVERQKLPAFVHKWGYGLVKKQIDKVNRIASAFRYFTPFGDIFEEAAAAQQVVSLNAQFGEGWLLPAEIMSYAAQGVRDVISLQPFGCIANQIVSKGIEKRIRQCYPDMNLLSLDFDSGVSDVNITNRLLLFIDKLDNSTVPRGNSTVTLGNRTNLS